MSLTVSRDLGFLDSRVLSRLKHLDLGGNVISMDPCAFGYGGFSDVFKGRCRIGKREVLTAIKRFRMHVDKMNCKEVSASCKQ